MSRALAARFTVPSVGLLALSALGGACHREDPSSSAPSPSASAAVAPRGSAVPASSFTGPLGANAAAPPAGSSARPPGETTSPVRKPVAPVVEAAAALAKTIRGYHGRLGFAMVDIESGELIAAIDDRAPLNPASNTKLFTAAAALSILHPSHRFETALYGKRDGTSVDKLVLRGRGDPSLATRDLWAMVRELRESGVRRVEGDVLVDQRYFDENYTPPAFEQQPNEWAYFRAPVSAVALNENTLTLNVRPAQAADAPAQAWFDPAGFVDIDGEVKTSADDRPQNVILALSPNGHRLAAKVGGTVPAGFRPLSFTRRVDDPSLLAGYAIKSLLVGAGITVGGDVKAGAGEGATDLLVMHRSAPLSELLYEVGKFSNNFYAEMILKTVGAEKKGRPGSSASGAQAVLDYITELGVVEPGTVLRNGSGLYDANRVTASETARLLRAAYRDPAISSEFVSQLAVGGVDGTLHGRFRDQHEPRIVRAKTGTLDSAVALSGYVLAPPGRGPLAFSILVNDIEGKVSAGRAAADKCVEAAAHYLWSR
jgi:D-alanyl-D-alanine carboxypeptidase/D-alanyl-D-alanine-endopeptidase (penicillin-binding protein 4)